MTLSAEIIALNQIQQGEYVGYGSSYTASCTSNIAVVSIGYGDGYPRAYVKPNFVAINQQLVAVVGRISMDMIAIDVTHINAEVGTAVELWGKHRLVDDVAAANGTIGYELLCRLSNRPMRKVI
jgi:alanine racemase